MTHIKVKTICPICEQENIISGRKPNWGQTYQLKNPCRHCGSEWTIKLVRVQGNVYEGKDVEVFQTLIKLGPKTNPRMIQGAIKRGKASLQERTSLWNKLMMKVGIR